MSQTVLDLLFAAGSVAAVLQDYNTFITLPSWLLSPGDLVTVCSLRFLLPAEVSMFGSRLFISAAFSLLWVFTPSLFSTKVRGFGLGISNASGRCGELRRRCTAHCAHMHRHVCQSSCLDSLHGSLPQLISTPCLYEWLLSMLCTHAAKRHIRTPHQMH